MVRHSFGFCLFLTAAISAAHAHEQNELTEFVSHVDDCLKAHTAATEVERRDCLRTSAISFVFRSYRDPARNIVLGEFEDSYPTVEGRKESFSLIASATHTKDVAYPGPASREYLLQLMRQVTPPSTPAKIVARLARARGDSIDVQIGRFLESRFDFDRDLEPLYRLNTAEFFAELTRRTPPAGAFVKTLAVEKFVTDDVSCPKVREVARSLASIRVPLPPQVDPARRDGTAEVEEIIVMHPHIVALYVPAYPVALRIQDHGMRSDVYRWVVKATEELAPCWR